jgi:hypothetical protein
VTAVQLKVKVPLALEDGPDRLGAEAGGCTTLTVPVALKALQPPALQACTR